MAYELEINFYKYKENNSEQLISIIIPARNEEGNRELFIKALNKFKRKFNKFEIIVNIWFPKILKLDINKSCLLYTSDAADE